MFSVFLPLLIFRLSYTVIWRHRQRPPACFHFAVQSSAVLSVCRFSLCIWSSAQFLFLPLSFIQSNCLSFCWTGWQFLFMVNIGTQSPNFPSPPKRHDLCGAEPSGAIKTHASQWNQHGTWNAYGMLLWIFLWFLDMRATPQSFFLSKSSFCTKMKVDLECHLNNLNPALNAGGFHKGLIINAQKSNSKIVPKLSWWIVQTISLHYLSLGCAYLQYLCVLHVQQQVSSNWASGLKKIQ